MISTGRVSTVVVAATIAFGSIGVPAMATTSSHWSKAQCQSWKNGFTKRNPHATKARKEQGNRVLKGKGCTQRV